MPSQSRFTINGLIDTNRPVMQNLEEICNSSGCWFTFDNVTGRWSVIINQAGNSTFSFNNSNIISGITLNGTGLTDLYNSVRVTYPLADIKDAEDFVQITLPEAQWNPNEVQNTLDISLPLVNNQVQAQLIGFRDLKQSRVNEIISFEADYTALGIRAGDIVDVTNSALGLNQALYRITEVVESDDVDRGITLSITAILYAADVYDEDDLQQYTISTENGIVAAGAIGTPPTPQITKFDIDSRPRLVIETDVPAGRVEAMEFWLATGNSGNTYNLVGTTAAPPGSVFTVSEEVTLDIDNLNAANYFCKTRGINSTTSGPFSNVSSLISYVPTQAPDAINQNANLVDENGNLITAFLLSELAAWAFSKAPNWLGNGGILDDLGFNTSGNDFVTSTGALASDSVTAITQNIAEANVIASLSAQVGNTYAFTVPGNVSTRVYNPADGIGNISSSGVNWSFGGSLLQITVETPPLVASFDYIDPAGNVATKTNFVAQPPLNLIVRKGSTFSTATTIAEATIDWQSNRNTFNIDAPTSDTYWVGWRTIPTYDLSMYFARSETMGGNITADKEIYFYDYTWVPDLSNFRISQVMYQ
jgi:hypothetical protein